jgi:predicted amidohydrolase
MSNFDKRSVRVGVLQTRIVQGERDDNLRRASALFAQVARHEPDLVVLPEAFATGVNFVILRQMAEPVPGGATSDAAREFAERHATHVAAGILEAGDDGRIYDSAVVFGPKGELLGKYRRRFLWVGERSYLSAGGEPLIVDTPIGRIGVIVGYDLCFPEASETFLQSDVDIVVCPSSVFERLNYSAGQLGLLRAMDHHCYFVYANAVGFHQFANMRYTGRSAIFADPYFLQVQLARKQQEGLGCLARASLDEEVVVGDLHIEDLRRARVKNLPFKDDARFTLERARDTGATRSS